MESSELRNVNSVLNYYVLVLRQLFEVVLKFGTGRSRKREDFLKCFFITSALEDWLESEELSNDASD
jgi:hypothetical protein